MMRQVVVGIPVRMGSSRFPGKPLIDICGMPMVEHVWRRCLMSDAATRVVIAGCDNAVREWAIKAGADYVDTDPSITRPSVRVAAATRGMQLANDDIVVVVQGDEPLVQPNMIESAVTPLDNGDIFATNLCAKASMEDLRDPAEIKVVCDLEGNALYMSRSPIPNWDHADSMECVPLRQVCIFGFRSIDLYRMAFEMGETPLERAESIEMNRILENGGRVRMVQTSHRTKSVDTPQDHQVAEALLAQDALTLRYSHIRTAE